MFVVASTAQAQTSKDQWVDSVFRQMSLDDKIGQLFVVPVSGDIDKSDLDELSSKAGAGTLGGVVFTSMHNLKQAGIITQLQSASRYPLLIGLDGSSGPGIRLDSALAYPLPQVLGAVANDSLIFFMGNEMARHMKLMGIHLTFISANLATQENRETNYSFGEDPLSVASKSLAFWNGLRSGGVLAGAKYFPIQGLRVTEVQKGVPNVQLTVDSAQAYPFKTLFKNHLPVLMPASAHLPMFYSQKKAAIKNLFTGSSLSAAFAGEWIRKHMNYNGLMMVDVEKMMESPGTLSAGEAEIFAFQAGNDMLVTSANVASVIRKMKKMLRTQKEFIPQLDSSVRKILALKYDAGLSKKQQPTDHLHPKLVTTEARLLQHKIYKAAPTVIANQRNTLPMHSLENKAFTCIIAGDSLKGKVFTERVSKYVQTTQLNVTERSDTVRLPETILAQQQVLLVALFPDTKEKTLLTLLPVLKESRINREVIVCDFGSTIFRAYAHQFPAVITAYTDQPEMLEILPQIIFGGLPAEGVLPVTFGQIPAGTSTRTPALDRLSYSFPEDAGMDAKTLDKIEAIAQEAISTGATPGCQILIAKEGKVIYDRAFGYLTYEKQAPATDETIYDLASLTKVTATLQTTMFLYEKGLIDINKKASVYLPELRTSNKKDFTLKDILTHQAGLWPFLPFWAHTMKDTVYLPEYYSHKLSPQYPLVVADRLYASLAMKDSLWSWIVKARIREKPDRTPYDYRYSDMGFYILQHLAERMLNQPMDDFLSQNLYEPLGAYTTGYRPLLRFPIRQIAPTENDKLFRRSLLIGNVHDQGAAMHGGVAGHAGLFSTANDLAKLGQMLLQEGKYGGLQYYKPETVRLFTRRQFENSRRGLGWDKPTPGDWNGPTSMQASPKTFGHTGFTGTCMWVDPEFNVVYIFLSNRVHPDMTNNKLLSANIRSRIQDVVYQSIFNYCKTAESAPEKPVSAPADTFGRSQ